MYNSKCDLDSFQVGIMIDPQKKSASNSVRLFDQLIAERTGLAPIATQACLHPTALPERLSKLKPLVAYEQSLLCNPSEHLTFYCAVAYGSLTDAFILTQRNAAVRRIESSTNPISKTLLRKHSTGERWISVGISHLTTSRQHMACPVVTAKAIPGGWSIRGNVPWVTAASASEALVIAACDSERLCDQYLFYIPMDSGSVTCKPSMDLLALTESHTCEVLLDGVELSTKELLHGPSENVLSVSQSSGAGGLQTTALALGLAACVIDRIDDKAQAIESIGIFALQFANRWKEIFDRMILASNPQTNSVDTAKLRKDANDLTLRVAQAYLAIEKGAGYLAHSDASRWIREAMFFLVWSCPQTIAKEHLCDLSHFHSLVEP